MSIGVLRYPAGIAQNSINREIDGRDDIHAASYYSERVRYRGGEPEIIAEFSSYIILYKPAGLHTVPLREGETGTLLDWCAQRYPEIQDLRGKKACEGGMVHRLDRDTRGLLIAARDQGALDYFTKLQTENGIKKYYTAVSRQVLEKLPGFPAPPAIAPSLREGPFVPAVVESGFRAYGRGRKAVRPVLSGEVMYRTGIVSRRDGGGVSGFDLVITRGFRHQIRCHLAWLGFPIVNDVLYGGSSSSPPLLGLVSTGLSFPDPETGLWKDFRIDIA